MAWVYIEREGFVRDCEKLGISDIVRNSIKAWAPTVSNKYQTHRSKRIYQSPRGHYELWSAGIPNPESNKGKSGGYRIVYFLNLVECSINLDFIEVRKELGFKDEGVRRKNTYSDYIRASKEHLRKLDE